MIFKIFSKGHHPLGNFVAATLETYKGTSEFDYNNEIHENFFEVSSIPATKLPSG